MKLTRESDKCYAVILNDEKIGTAEKLNGFFVNFLFFNLINIISVSSFDDNLEKELPEMFCRLSETIEGFSRQVFNVEKVFDTFFITYNNDIELCSMNYIKKSFQFNFNLPQSIKEASYKFVEDKLLYKIITEELVCSVFSELMNILYSWMLTEKSK